MIVEYFIKDPYETCFTSQKLNRCEDCFQLMLKPLSAIASKSEQSFSYMHKRISQDLWGGVLRSNKNLEGLYEKSVIK